jgi:hypothetical protein
LAYQLTGALGKSLLTEKCSFSAHSEFRRQKSSARMLMRAGSMRDGGGGGVRFGGQGLLSIE